MSSSGQCEFLTRELKRIINRKVTCIDNDDFVVFEILLDNVYVKISDVEEVISKLPSRIGNYFLDNESTRLTTCRYGICLVVIYRRVSSNFMTAYDLWVSGKS